MLQVGAGVAERKKHMQEARKQARGCKAAMHVKILESIYMAVEAWDNIRLVDKRSSAGNLASTDTRVFGLLGTLEFEVEWLKIKIILSYFF